MKDVPDFSSVASFYAASRPGYPSEMFTWLASVTPCHELAWDSATGSGQAALGLVRVFDRVVATDISEAQVRHAVAHPHIEYRVASAEASGLPAESVDLVAAAAALHWFDLPKFYREARRVARGGAVIAAWTYHIAHVEPPFDAVLWPFYRNVVAKYFGAGARLVDDRYASIVLPGRKLDAPAFTTSAEWNAGQILAFVRTWSGVQACTKATGEDPVARLAPAVEELCGSPERVHRLRWPIYLLASSL